MSLEKIFKKTYRQKCFTTPSHSQSFFITSKFQQFYKYDISETETHNPQEALDKAQEKACEIYGTKKTLFLTNGSTSGVITAILSCVKKNENVLIWKNAHPCHKNAVELAGANAIFYDLNIDDNWGIPTDITPETLETFLKKDKIKAVIITSPSYEGITCNIEKIQKICKKYETFLIVDEAHGALYPFSEKLPQSAVKIADFTIQSLHKTAGGLNPTALLHTNTDLDIKSALAKFTTTSPSYPLLLSIEKNINYLNSQKGRQKLNELLNNIQNLKQSCSNIEFYDGDLTKILIKHPKYNGIKLSEILFENDIEDEKTNEKSTLLLCGLGTSKAKIERLKKVLKSL